MKRRKFRSKLLPGEMLAIDPKALNFVFASPSTETVCEGGIAVVSICGPLEHHDSFFFDSYDDIVKRIEQAMCDDEVQAIALCIDSPGGDAAGAFETHRKIRRLRKQYGKPLFAYSNEAMYSAAYAIGSAADEVWLPMTGGVGSVGVIGHLVDRTKQNEKLGLKVELVTTGARKADSQPDRALTDDVIETMQARVDYLGDVFFRSVAKARGMSPSAVKDLEAGVFLGQDAVDAGLADGVAGWDAFLSHIRNALDLGFQSVGTNSKVSSNALDTRSVNPYTKSHASRSALERDPLMLTLLQATKNRDAAKAALLAAKNEKERAKLLAAYEAAVKDFIEAKMKYTKKTEETEEVDEEDEEEDSEDSEDEEDEEDDDDDDDEEEDEDDDDDDETSSSGADESEDEKKAMAMLGASSGLHTSSRLYRLCSQVTGKSDLREIFGALDAMGLRVKQAAKVERRLAKLEGENRRAKVDAMLTKAKAEGRVASAKQFEQLHAMGMKDPRQLKGFLSSTPKALHTIEDGGHRPDVNAKAQTLEMSGLNADQRKLIEQGARDAGCSFEEYAAKLNETMAKKNINGAGTAGRF